MRLLIKMKTNKDNLKICKIPKNGKKKPSIFETAKDAPTQTEDQAYDNALEAVQTYLNLINNDVDKIDEFKDIIINFCSEAKNSK